MSGDKTVIRLDTLSGKSIYLEADGDCCSSSWFEHIEGLDAIAGHEIKEITEREMPPAREDPEHDHLQFYGWTFETERGRCDLEMRNASNGYYGGNLNLSDSPSRKYEGGKSTPYELAPLVEDF